MNGKNLTKPLGGRKQKMDFVFTKRIKNEMTEQGVFSHPVILNNTASRER